MGEKQSSPVEQLKQLNQFIIKTENTVNLKVYGDEDERIKKFNYRYRMLSDDFYDQVCIELGNIYTEAVKLGLITQVDDTNNVYKMVMEEISKVYKDEPTREFDESTQVEMETLYELMNITEIMEQINLYTNAFNDCLLQVGVKDEKLNLKIRRPDNTVVVTNEDGDLTKVAIFLHKEDNISKWRVYTDTEIYEILTDDADSLLKDPKENDYKKAIGDSTDFKNQLGFIPFIPFHNGFRDCEFWQMFKGDDIVKGTIQISVKLTFLNHLIKLQSFKQLIASGSNLRTLNEAVIDPQTILYLDGTDTSISALDLTSDYKQLWDTIEAINNNIARNYKISTNFFRMTGSPSSGFALKMENIRLDSFIQKQKKYFAKKEVELFSMMKKVDEKLKLNQIKGNPPKVNFPIDNYPKTDMEKLEEQEKAIALGKTNMPEIIEKEEGLTEDEAKQKYAKNIELRNKGNEQFNTPSVTTSLPIEQNEGN